MRAAPERYIVPPAAGSAGRRSRPVGRATARRPPDASAATSCHDDDGRKTCRHSTTATARAAARPATACAMCSDFRFSRLGGAEPDRDFQLTGALAESARRGPALGLMARDKFKSFGRGLERPLPAKGASRLPRRRGQALCPRAPPTARHGRAPLRGDPEHWPLFEPHRPAEPGEIGWRPTAQAACRNTSRPATSPRPSRELVATSETGERDQVLLGVTGSGKTFTMAKVIEATQRPALILAHNKTLAAQLYSEFKSFFPDNAVEYFVSYYDYYQPEAYVPQLRYLSSRRNARSTSRSTGCATPRRGRCSSGDDVIIVASVQLHLRHRLGRDLYGHDLRRLKRRRHASTASELIADLVALQYKRNDQSFVRGTFRVRGDTVEIFPAHYEDRAWRVSLFGDEVEEIAEFDPLTGQRSGDARRDQALRQFALCDAAPDAQSGDGRDQARPSGPPAGTEGPGQAAGSPAPRTTHAIRHRDDGGDRKLRRHRELFALPDGPQARRAAAHSLRVPARQRAGLRRRKPCHRAADRRHVPRRLPAQIDAGRIRLPPALLRRQPADALRGMERDAAAIGLRLGDARPLGDGTHRRRLRRTGDPPDRPDRPADLHPPGRDAGRRPHRRVPRGRGQGPACAGHNV